MEFVSSFIMIAKAQWFMNKTNINLGKHGIASVLLSAVVIATGSISKIEKLNLKRDEIYIMTSKQTSKEFLESVDSVPIKKRK